MNNTHFGIILATYHKDVWMLKAALESIRYYCGDIPVCVIVDGAIDLDHLAKRYDISLIYKRDLKDPLLTDPTLRAHPKMIAFWHSPFEHFLMMDADTLMWGDVTQLILNQSASFLHTNISNFSRDQIDQWFFDTRAVTEYWPHFRWENRILACSGVFYAQRGILERATFEGILHKNRDRPGLFKMPDQGYLNFLLLLHQDEGKIQMDAQKIQTIACDHPLDDLKRDFKLIHTRPPKEPEAPTILHYAGGVLPTRKNKETLSEPMTWFRLSAMRKKGGIFRLMPSFFLALEDFLIIPEYSRTLFGRVKRRFQILLEPIRPKLW